MKKRSFPIIFSLNSMSCLHSSMPHFIITPHLYNFRELPSTYHPCGLLEVEASRVILRQPTFISHLLIGLSPFTFLEDGRLLSEKIKTMKRRNCHVANITLEKDFLHILKRTAWIFHGLVC